jgi:pimeloyl-ACP methyl ester carboxylesterase
MLGADYDTIRLDQGPVRYRRIGAGDPIVFVHGLLVDGRLWNGVAERLATRFDCIVPDWPMGSHVMPMRESADLSPPGQAQLVADLIGALGLDRATVVGNDTGGAVAQIVAAHHPERVARLVLTNCDTFEHFPPFPFSLMPPVARLPGGMTALSAPFRLGPVRRATYGLLVERPLDPALVDSWLEPSLRDRAILRDARKLVAGAHNRQTLDAAERLRGFDRPALLAWGMEDRFFKLDHARRLATVIGAAPVVEIDGGRTFVPLDRPDAVAAAIDGHFDG